MPGCCSLGCHVWVLLPLFHLLDGSCVSSHLFCYYATFSLYKHCTCCFYFHSNASSALLLVHASAAVPCVFARSPPPRSPVYIALLVLSPSFTFPRLLPAAFFPPGSIYARAAGVRSKTTSASARIRALSTWTTSDADSPYSRFFHATPGVQHLPHFRSAAGLLGVLPATRWQARRGACCAGLFSVYLPVLFSCSYHFTYCSSEHAYGLRDVLRVLFRTHCSLRDVTQNHHSGIKKKLLRARPWLT